MAAQPWSFMPKTKSGQWSLGLIIAMPLLFIIGTSFTTSLYQSVPSGDTIVADIAVRPALALTMLAGMAAGILAFITGLLAIIKQKEKAILVVISSLIGALVIVRPPDTSDPGDRPGNEGFPQRPEDGEGNPDPREQEPPDEGSRPPEREEGAQPAPAPRRSDESPEEYARRVLAENADFQTSPLPRNLHQERRSGKDW